MSEVDQEGLAGDSKASDRQHEDASAGRSDQGNVTGSYRPAESDGTIGSSEDEE